jgi:N-glycosylase/DNA lyase
MVHYTLPFSLPVEIQGLIEQRLAEFKAIGAQDTFRWFSELCFCLLTANAQAKKAIAIQEHIGIQGFLYLPEKQLAHIIQAHGHRFHNTKAHYIVNARPYITIKESLAPFTTQEARTFLIEHIKGLGYKEASHFLRNVGYSDVAILDRHILTFLVQYGYLTKIPKTLTPKLYLALEEELKKFHIPLDKLDLILWYHITGTVLK